MQVLELKLTLTLLKLLSGPRRHCLWVLRSIPDAFNFWKSFDDLPTTKFKFENLVGNRTAICMECETTDEVHKSSGVCFWFYSYNSIRDSLVGIGCLNMNNTGHDS